MHESTPSRIKFDHQHTAGSANRPANPTVAVDMVYCEKNGEWFIYVYPKGKHWEVLDVIERHVDDPNVNLDEADYEAMGEIVLSTAKGS